ncbi:MAG TPA: hypothetical protein VF824_19540 [Thermoanaerobaculia bacterium]|jgi:hypothetical protein
MKNIARLFAALTFAASLAAQTPTTDPQAFDRILVPLLSAPVNGAFGSQFRTELTLWNRSTEQPVTVWGLQRFCPVELCFVDPNQPLHLEPQSWVMPADIVNNGTPARFIYVPKGESGRLAANLRAFDVSRNATNFGTELRVVRERDFSTRIVLPGVPLGSQFRNTLRVYANEPVTVQVSFEGPEIIGSPTILPPQPEFVTLAASRNVFEPAYGVLSTFQGYGAPVAVIVEPVGANVPVWAFVSVTNNETQHITTISPQP